MASTGFGPVITLPTPALRPWGLLLPTARRVDFGPRFPLGVTFQPFDFTPLFFNDSDCTPVDLPDTPRDYPDAQEQAAFSVWDAVRCSTLFKTPDEITEDIRTRWPNLISHAFATELLSGAASGGVGLDDVDQATTGGADFVDSIGILEQALAVGLSGSQGMMHMSPMALAEAVAAGVVNLRGGVYYSPGGHIIIADSGYQDANDTLTSVMYASGPVYWDIIGPDPTSPLMFENIDYARNIIKGTEVAYGILVFDQTKVWSTTAVLSEGV